MAHASARCADRRYQSAVASGTALTATTLLRHPAVVGARTKDARSVCHCVRAVGNFQYLSRFVQKWVRDSDRLRTSISVRRAQEKKEEKDEAETAPHASQLQALQHAGWSVPVAPADIISMIAPGDMQPRRGPTMLRQGPQQEQGQDRVETRGAGCTLHAARLACSATRRRHAGKRAVRTRQDRRLCACRRTGAAERGSSLSDVRIQETAPEPEHTRDALQSQALRHGKQALKTRRWCKPDVASQAKCQCRSVSQSYWECHCEECLLREPFAAQARPPPCGRKCGIGPTTSSDDLMCPSDRKKGSLTINDAMLAQYRV